MRLDDHVRERTALRCKYRYYQFQVMPFGLMKVATMFQRMTIRLLRDMSYLKVCVDSVVLSLYSMPKHIDRLDKICTKRGNGLKMKVSKSDLPKTQSKFSAISSR